MAPSSNRAKRVFSSAWPYAVFGAIVLTYTYFYFGKSNQSLLAYLQFLLNAIVGLAVVLYVIYTGRLVKSGQQTADANLQLIETMRSYLVEEWVAQERPAREIQFVPGGEEISRALHVQSIGMPPERYEQECQRDKLRVLIFRPFNGGPRLLLLKRVKLEIGFGKGGPREISCDLERPLRIPQNASTELHVLYDFVGQIEARVIEIEYLDGVRVQKTWVANPWSERTYFAPESTTVAEPGVNGG
jgi:hypothetical protein